MEGTPRDVWQVSNKRKAGWKNHVFAAVAGWHQGEVQPDSPDLECGSLRDFSTAQALGPRVPVARTGSSMPKEAGSRPIREREGERERERERARESVQV